LNITIHSQNRHFILKMNISFIF